MEKLTEQKLLYFYPSTGNIAYFINPQNPTFIQKIIFDYHAPAETASIKIENSLFLIGGDQIITKPSQTQHIPINSVYEIQISDTNKQKTLEKANLNYARCGIGLEKYKNYIYAIGGCFYKDKWESVNFCEKYDVISDKWYFLPPLNERKSYVCACQMNDNVYTFGGYSYPSGCKLTKFEKLDLKNEKSWEILEVLNSDKTWVPRRGCGATQISESKILIFGGISKPPDFCANYLFTESSCEKKKYEISANAEIKMKNKGGHWNHIKNIVKIEEKYYAISYDFGLHIYDIKKNCWEFIKLNKPK